MSKGGVNVIWEVKEAERRFQEIFAQQVRLSRKSAAQEFKRQAKGVLRFVLAVTPPMGGKQASTKKVGRNITIDFAGAKKASKARIEADIARAFIVPRGKNVKKYGADEALSHYLKRRNDKKRITGKFQLPVTLEAKNAVKKNILARQGWVPSGWNSAESSVGNRPPGWISAWGSKLNQRFSAVWEGDEVYFEAVNGTNHKDSNAINTRIAWAIREQSAAMLRSIAKMSEKQLQEKLRKG